MKVFKFGGASIKSAEAVRNLEKIIQTYPDKLVVVISAMGKITNALEKVTEDYYHRRASLDESLNRVKDFHGTIIPSCSRSHRSYLP